MRFRSHDVARPPVVTVAGDMFSAEMPQLVNGVRYDVTVKARNEVGWSRPAAAAATPHTIPGAPAVVSVSPDDGAAVVRWSPPTRDGGAPITAYVVRAAHGDAVASVEASSTRARIKGLRNGVPSTFTVAAVNRAGRGPASGQSDATPRKLGRFVIKDQPRGRVVYGERSNVRTALVRPGGVGLPGQRVELLAKLQPSRRWRQVDAATTNFRGRATVGTTLPASTALRLHHPAGAVAASDVRPRSVVVANRVTREVGVLRTRVGMPVVVRGTVAPRHRVGSEVRLQRRVSGSWVRVATGRMTTRSRYAVRWKPRRVNTYVLRVVKPRGPARAAGATGSWRHRVDPESAADIARDILRDRGTTLATVHLSAGSDGATAKQNLVDVANQRLARTSCYGNPPCRSTALDRRMLAAVREMGTRATITVSEFAGGNHASTSAHHSGRGVDITWVHGTHVGYGTNYWMVVKVCRSYGANEVFNPSSDPWGGHSRHVHCGW